MVQAYLREKAEMFYIVVSYYDEQHKRKQIWIATKLKAKGNKRKARAMLNEYKYYYDIEKRELVYPPVIQHENNIIGTSYLTEIFSKEEKKQKTSCLVITSINGMKTIRIVYKQQLMVAIKVKL